MQIKCLYFAKYREALLCSEEELQLPDSVETLFQLRQYLGDRGEAWSEIMLNQVPPLMALNHGMIKQDVQLSDADEVAFFPPVSGG